MKKFITLILVVCLAVVPLNYSALTDTNAAYNTAESISQGVENNAEYSTTSVDLTQGTTSGFLDIVGNENIGGWAWNDAYPNTSIDVHVHIRQGETICDMKSVVAGDYRSDLWSAGYGNGYHGFNCAVDWYNYWPGDYQVWAFGINNSNNPHLYNSPTTFTVQASTGYVEGVTPTSIYGWAWKPSCPNRPVAIHVYIRDMEGNVVTVLGADADDYRSDLWVAGYGNGFHGFTIPFDWSQMPRQRYIVEVHPVDHSGFNPIIYNEVYDNRNGISLLGAIGAFRDENENLIGMVDFSGWMNAEVQQDCLNICKNGVNVYNQFDSDDALDALENSSFCLIHTHGIYSLIECNKNGNRSYLQSYNIRASSNRDFSNTDCVVFFSCMSGEGGSANSSNLVNTLQKAGVKTVVGFESEIFFYVKCDANGIPIQPLQIDPNLGNSLWGAVFIEKLSEGYTVRAAADEALRILTNNNTLSACGLDSIYIGDNENQIIKG